MNRLDGRVVSRRSQVDFLLRSPRKKVFVAFIRQCFAFLTTRLILYYVL